MGFMDDVAKAKPITIESMQQEGAFTRFAEAVCRVLSPVL